MNISKIKKIITAIIFFIILLFFLLFGGTLFAKSDFSAEDFSGEYSIDELNDGLSFPEFDFIRIKPRNTAKTEDFNLTWLKNILRDYKFVYDESNIFAKARSANYHFSAVTTEKQNAFTDEDRGIITAGISKIIVTEEKIFITKQYSSKENGKITEESPYLVFSSSNTELIKKMRKYCESMARYSEDNLFDMSDEDFITAAKKLGYSDEQLERLAPFIGNLLTKGKILNPTENISSYMCEETTADGKYYFCIFAFDPFEVKDELGAIYIPYIKNLETEEIRIIPENIDENYLNIYKPPFGILDNEYFVFGTGGTRIYEFKNPSEPKISWSALEIMTPKNKGYIPDIVSYPIPEREEIIAFWVDRSADFDNNSTKDGLTHYFITILDKQCKIKETFDTGIPVYRSKGDVALVQRVLYEYPKETFRFRLEYGNTFDLVFSDSGIEIKPLSIKYYGSGEYDNWVIEATDELLALEINGLYVTEKMFTKIEKTYSYYYTYDPVTEEELGSNPYIYYICTFVDGTDERLLYTDAPTGCERPYIGETENTLIYLYDETGKRLNDVPYEDACIDTYWFPSFYNRMGLHGVIDGKVYFYEYDGENFNFTSVNEGMAWDAGFGFTKFDYYWNWHSPKRGIMDSNGNIIIDPVYEYLNMPFEDRIILYNGIDLDYMGGEQCLSELVDLEGNVLCSRFHQMSFTVFDDGSYVGIGKTYPSYNDYYNHPIYDKNGRVYEEGFWFIDKDGNILSERFDFCHNGFWSDLRIESPDDYIGAFNEFGEHFPVKISDYICK
ncbi:MAG: hypothetical protein E7489_02085 [Ruminococcaceae bacterium]|nr:hypothetical protein [Oscillospiraceae bacterium]